MPKNSALLFFNVDSTESPDGLQSVLSSVAFPGRLLSLELLSELHWAPLYTQCRLAVTARNPYWTPGFFFFLVLSFLTYQNIAGRCVDSVSFQCAICSVPQAGERCSGRGVTRRRCGARVRFPIERSMTRQKTDRRYCSTSRATGISGAAWPAGAAFQSVLTADARAKRRWLGLGCPPWRGVAGGGCLRARVFGSNSCNYMPQWPKFQAFVHKLWPIFAFEKHWKSLFNT